MTSVGGQALIPVAGMNPLFLACAECVWAPDGCWPAAPAGPLPEALLGALVDHWAAERHKRVSAARRVVRGLRPLAAAGLDEGAAR